MDYEQSVEREVRLSERDFVELFRNQEVEGDDNRIFIKKLDFLRALGRLDSLVQLTEEERDELWEEHRTPDVDVIESEPVEEDFDDG